MTVWDWITWLALVILGPGAVVVFLAFLRDLRRYGGPGGQDEPGQ